MSNVRGDYRDIVRYALEMFKLRGVKGVRMEDVSKELKISKRTLYEKFKDKEELLLECVKLSAEIKKEKHMSFMAKSNNVMQELCFVLQNALEEFSKYNAKFFVEVIKYRSVRELLDENAQKDAEVKRAFFQKAIDEGFVIPDVNLELISLMTRAAVDALLEEKAYETYTLPEIFNTSVMLFLRGILTEKGREELDACLTL